ncbi:ammonium transporter Rh type A-like isoform X1 [Varroa jacobsoni]|uniref:ammonium transporter Rh type A-like isoform X1 n=1 Tax=Varroa jacobsoni TaxID=62625 RepID=UPI000BF63AAD|nr:ammonium transporter Rh type A-like isoform X1 [Varroa jacobsoni]XP_022685925.1 ammonium transporter Rh type A-like isoform X1 [Varroa jacobsoni]XP_022685931.1 ammonium transporter Rh type A-like isoform X1 [Varroa jacobsoni]
MERRKGNFSAALIVIQLVLTLLTVFFVKYDEEADATNPKHSYKRPFGGADPQDNPIEKFYPMFQDINVMIYVGFGFLMTFLRLHGFTATGYTLLSSTIAMQTSILVRGALDEVHNGYISLGVERIIEGLFSSTAVLVSFGAIIGKISPLQLIVMTVIEVVVFAINAHLGMVVLQAVDVGGSMFLHTFGAYFGLALTFVLYRKDAKISTKEESSRTSDIFAMIGTLFLWMHYPSFNAISVEGDARHRAVLNTYMALCGSCVTTFALSSLTDEHNRLSMVHVQNATLAGGVAIGCTADMMIHPYGALIVGLGAGVISTLGYRYLQPMLLRYRIHDTCGVNNLHGMPGVFGGIIGVIVAASADYTHYNDQLYERYPARAPVANSTDLKEAQQLNTDLEAGLGLSGREQALQQLAALTATLGIALVSGLLTGFILALPLFNQIEGENLFDDELHWEVPEISEDDSILRPKPLEMLSTQVIRRHTNSYSQDQGTGGTKVTSEDVNNTSVKF